MKKVCTIRVEIQVSYLICLVAVQNELQHTIHQVGKILFKQDELEKQMFEIKTATEDISRELSNLINRFELKERITFSGIQCSKQIMQGSVTMVATEVHFNYSLWNQYPEIMLTSAYLHNYLLRELLERFSGYEVGVDGTSSTTVELLISSGTSFLFGF